MTKLFIPQGNNVLFMQILYTVCNMKRVFPFIVQPSLLDTEPSAKYIQFFAINSFTLLLITGLITRVSGVYRFMFIQGV